MTMSGSVRPEEGSKTPHPKPRIAVLKLASCDGCQLAFLGLGDKLLELSGQVEIVHFAEAGPLGPLTGLDITFIEGSLSTREDRDMVLSVRKDPAVEYAQFPSDTVHCFFPYTRNLCELIPALVVLVD